MEIRKVMLVDDEADIRRIGQIALESVGHWEVVLAGNGTEAVVLAAQQRPDVILLDVMMPGMDGPTTLEHLRAQGATARTPVIFMTAKVQRHEVDRYLALGAIGVIGKPFDPMALAGTIRALLAGRPA